MKTFTNKERADIYLEAAKGIDDGTEFACCLAIATIIKEAGPVETFMGSENFPELFLFAQVNEHSPYWWTHPFHMNYDSQQERILGLLLSREIALNP